MDDASEVTCWFVSCGTLFVFVVSFVVGLSGSGIVAVGFADDVDVVVLVVVAAVAGDDSAVSLVLSDELATGGLADITNEGCAILGG